MKSLILAEKPSVGSSIAGAIGGFKKNKGYFENNNYIITWALGHLIELASPEDYSKNYEKWNMEDLPIIPNEMKLKVIKGSSRQFRTVKELLYRKDVDQVIIATDAGREGELVARWILEFAKVKKKTKRLWISSVTDKAIRDGFKNLKDGRVYYNLYRAANARAIADWIVGINGSRALTVKYNTSLSCGRVQTPTLNMVNIREREIANFKPRNYFNLELVTREGKFNWANENKVDIYNEEKIREVSKKIVGDFKIVSVEERDVKKYPDRLYDLTNLQKDANEKFGFSTKKTAQVMQSLYENKKVLTYPRTDSRYITDDIVPTIPERLRAMSTGSYREIVREILKNGIKPTKHFVDNSKVSDHHGIIPTEEPLRLDELSSDELKIYNLVANRFLSVLLKPSVYREKKVIGEIKGERFFRTVSELVDTGFEILYRDNLESPSTKTLSKGSSIPVESVVVVKNSTKPPKYFNEGTLLLAMENPGKYFKISPKNRDILKETKGIGTVATRGEIIEKLYNSDLIEDKNGDIRITSKGRQLLEVVPEELKSPEMTAIIEDKLLKVEKGKLKDQDFIVEISNFSRENIEEIKNSEYNFRHENMVAEKCPECGKNLLKVNRKDREMLVCSDPECSYRRTISQLTNSRCPTCHKKLYLVGEGERKFFQCSTCGHRESYDNFLKRKESKKNQMSKREVSNYLKNQGGVELNNGFDALKDLFK